MIATSIGALIIGLVLGVIIGLAFVGVGDFDFFSPTFDRPKMDESIKKKRRKGLSRKVKTKNVQVKPYTETSTLDFAPPKGVCPNTTSSIKHFKQ